MKYGVLGTGMVGQALAGKLVALGHDVMMGSRDAKNPKSDCVGRTRWPARTGRDVRGDSRNSVKSC